MISRVLYKQITISVSGHCMHFLLKTCQSIAGITLSSQFNEFFGAILWRVFDLWPHLVVASKLGTDKGGTQQLFSDQGVCVMGKSRRICPSTLNFHTQLLPRLNQQAAAAATAAALASRLLLATTQGTYVACIDTWLLDK